MTGGSGCDWTVLRGIGDGPGSGAMLPVPVGSLSEENGLEKG
ncbi:hypothetical protein [Enterovirga sp.]|nr:hypothetical protein [Enterovirga sp.]HMO28711.1 hypothetical protein [Enterovirga sp.]